MGGAARARGFGGESRRDGGSRSQGGVLIFFRRLPKVGDARSDSKAHTTQPHCYLPAGHAGRHIAQRDPVRYPLLRFSWSGGEEGTNSLHRQRRALRKAGAVHEVAIDPTVVGAPP